MQAFDPVHTFVAVQATKEKAKSGIEIKLEGKTRIYVAPHFALLSAR